MKNNGMDFEEHEGSVSDLNRYVGISGYIVFDITLGKNFRQKARSWVDWQNTESLLAITYNTLIS